MASEEASPPAAASGQNPWLGYASPADGSAAGGPAEAASGDASSSTGDIENPGAAGGEALPEEASAGAPQPSTRSEASDGGNASPPASEGGKEFALLSGRFIYDEGAMVSKSAALRGLQRKPFVEMNDEDAKELGIADGDLVILTAGKFEVQVPVVIEDIVRGSVFVPYDQEGLHANELMRGVNPRVRVSRR